MESPWAGDNDAKYGQHASKLSQNGCFCEIPRNYTVFVDSWRNPRWQQTVACFFALYQIKKTYDAWNKPSNQQLQVDVCGSSREFSFISKSQECAHVLKGYSSFLKFFRQVKSGAHTSFFNFLYKIVNPEPKSL